MGKYLDVERKRIDNMGSDVQNLDESIGKAIPNINNNSEKLDALISQLKEIENNLQLQSQINDETKSNVDKINTRLLEGDKLAEEINGVLEKHDDNINLILTSLDQWQVYQKDTDTKHLETVEKMKEISVLIETIKEQIVTQEKEITEKSASDFDDIKLKMEHLENRHDASNKRISELDNGSQSLLQKLISLEKDISERCGNLDKTDEQLLSMINKMGNENESQFSSLRLDINNKWEELENKNNELEKNVISENNAVKQIIEDIKSNHNSALVKLTDMDNGNQQLLEKLLNLESDVDQKYFGMNSKSDDMKSRVDKIDIEIMNNSQGLVNIQEIVNIQTEQVKKVESERQKSSEESNKALEASTQANKRAIDDMRKELGDAIHDLEVKLKTDRDQDNQTLDQRIILIQNQNKQNEEKISALEKDGPETTKNIMDNLESKFKVIQDDSYGKLKDIEHTVTKNSEDLKSQSKFIENHNDEIKTIVSSVAVFTSQISALETKEDDIMKYLDVERKRIDNMGSDIQNLDESIGKAIPNINNNSEKLDALISQLKEIEDNLQLQSQINVETKSNVDKINIRLLEGDKLAEEINGVLEKHDDNIKLILTSLDQWQVYQKDTDTKHLETVEKMKEISVLIETIKEQIVTQEKKITEKSASDFDDIKLKMEHLENGHDASNKRISELDNGSQSLLQKLISLEKDIS